MINLAIKYPVTTTVGVLLLTLFGVLALVRIPIQLIPTVVEPVVTVTTIWPGASPQEIEREIVDKQEEHLKSLNGLLEMKSSSQDSQGQIRLKFQTGMELNEAIIQVSNRLEQVQSYPADVDKPVITTVDADASAMAWFVIQPHKENPFQGDIATMFHFLENEIKPEVERVSGVARSNIFGGVDREMHVTADPVKLAAMGISLNQLGIALEAENRNYSGGDFDEGKRRYVVRTVGEYKNPEDIANVVITVRNGVPVYVRDVAEVTLSYQKPQFSIFYHNKPMMAMNAIRQQGYNVLEVMDELNENVARINKELLNPIGLEIDHIWDETQYIESAIDLVQKSLVFGGILAIIILLLFLRSGTSTIVIAVAIPISVIGTFLMMNLLGRTINVISLAGMAFAVGMVVDNSIVVLENIFRHLQMGKSRRQAALEGAREVWGAVLASTLTTIAVFVPVVFVQEEAGQLFRDIAIAISCAVGLSLLVSITVIPSFSAKILRGKTKDPREESGFGNWFSTKVADLVAWICGSLVRRLTVVVAFTAAAILGSWWLLPKAEYLPSGNQNFLFGIVLPPPGLNLDEMRVIGDIYAKELGQYWEADDETAAKMPGEGIKDFFFGAGSIGAFMGVNARNPLKVRDLLPVFMQANGKIPGTFAFTMQASIFQSSMDGGRSIDIEITGPKLENLIGLGGQIFGGVMQNLPGSQARPIPSLDLGNPEIQVIPDRRRAAEQGITNRDLGFAVSALIDGIKVSEVRHQGYEIDMKLKVPDSSVHRTHLLEQMPLATPSGEMVTLGSVAEVSVINGPVQIEHRERQRAIIIQVTPPETMPLQEAMETIRDKIVGPLEASGQVSGAYRIRMSGTADKLTQTGKSLIWNFVLAVVITYLLLSALFENFVYPFVILFSVPLAAFGGFLGLKCVNTFIAYQALDVLTMLGFIILVGTVVNNAILIVHQSLIHIRIEGMDIQDAIRTASKSRVRPIFMSVMTSVFGMLPLVLFPGAGSELYRGLGSVVVGGLVISTVFTLFLVPAMLSLCLGAREWLVKNVGLFAKKAEKGMAAG